jgi:hypothetical protein
MCGSDGDDDELIEIMMGNSSSHSRILTFKWPRLTHIGFSGGNNNVRICNIK